MKASAGGEGGICNGGGGVVADGGGYGGAGSRGTSRIGPEIGDGGYCLGGLEIGGGRESERDFVSVIFGGREDDTGEPMPPKTKRSSSLSSESSEDGVPDGSSDILRATSSHGSAEPGVSQARKLVNDEEGHSLALAVQPGG